jgi:hypothetical protein
MVFRVPEGFAIMDIKKKLIEVRKDYSGLGQLVRMYNLEEEGFVVFYPSSAPVRFSVDYGGAIEVAFPYELMADMCLNFIEMLEAEERQKYEDAQGKQDA